MRKFPVLFLLVANAVSALAVPQYLYCPPIYATASAVGNLLTGKIADGTVTSLCSSTVASAQASLVSCVRTMELQCQWLGGEMEYPPVDLIELSAGFIEQCQPHYSGLRSVTVTTVMRTKDFCRY